jgi:hypothetical protein
LSRRALWPRARPSDVGRTAACKGELFIWSSNLWMALAVAEASGRLVRLVRRKVCPEPMAPWPAWMRDLWLGPTGRDHGEDGLIRLAARKYSRQLNCALSLASQVSG